MLCMACTRVVMAWVLWSTTTTPEQLGYSTCNCKSSKNHRKSLQAPTTSSDLGATGLPAKGSSIRRGPGGLPAQPAALVGNAWLPRAATAEMSCPQLSQLMVLPPPPFLTGRGISPVLMPREQFMGLCPLTCQSDE